MVDFVRVPPDSTGKRLLTKEHTVDSTAVQVQKIHITDPNNPGRMMHVDSRGSGVMRFAEGSPAIAGFASLRVSDMNALGVYESTLDSYDSLFTVETSVSGGDSIYNAEQSQTILQVDGNNGSYVKRTTNRYHYYLPGTSTTFILYGGPGDNGKAGVTRRAGMYDDNDGLFFELAGTTFNMVVRTSVSGSAVEARVPSTNWTSVLSGEFNPASLDLTVPQTWWLDYTMAGRARFGIYDSAGARLVLHEVIGTGGLPFLGRASLPARTEIFNYAASGSPSILREISMAVYSEARPDQYTFWRFSGGVISKNVSAATTHLGSIRLQATVNGKHNAVQLFPESLNVYCDQPVSLTVAMDTAVTGGTWNAIPGSVAQANLDGTYAPTADTIYFKTMFFSAGSHRLEVSNWFELNDEGLLVRADDTPVVWSFLASPLTASPVALTFNIGYRELW